MRESRLRELSVDFERLVQGGHSARGVLERSAAARETARDLVDAAGVLLGRRVVPTKATFFDKTPSANWMVPWHQDLTITVQSQLDLDGFTHWRNKDGLWHVQPPRSILENTIALRVHLDPTPHSSGPLRVIPGSHRGGVLDACAIERWVESTAPSSLEVRRGDVIAMAPLLLHSSLRASDPRHRRVLHLEFSNARLPHGLAWCG